ncbi:MAG: 2OG-Fe(II) oxygenase family protein [Caulobacter sp.]|nr:2OG-Fe(II) oxygenase family protein [Caulobacter sp.]
MTAPLAIDPTLDPARIAPVFRRLGRIHLPGILDPGAAARVGEAIGGDQVPWVKSWRTTGPSLDGSLEAFEAMSGPDRAAFDADMTKAASDGFCFQFDAWRLSDDILAGKRRGGALAPLEAVHDLVNSEAFLGFIRTITGVPDCAYSDTMVSRYRSGDFLSAHDDAIAGKKRLFAYVLNFTPVWRADWGGVLTFLDEDGHVAEGYSPVFNALNIFTVPQAHAVSMVIPYANKPRLSVTGWIRSARDD